MRITCFALALIFAVCGPSLAQAKRDLSVWASPHSEQSIRQIPEWKKIAFDAGQAQAEGVTRKTFDTAIAGLEPDFKIPDLDPESRPRGPRLEVDWK